MVRIHRKYALEGGESVRLVRPERRKLPQVQDEPLPASDGTRLQIETRRERHLSDSFGSA
jgi:hypothetical protein